jgi:hypothetical protein
MQQLLKHLFQNAKNIFNHGLPPFVPFLVKQLQNTMVFGCKQDILTLLIILFSIFLNWKNSFQNF